MSWRPKGWTNKYRKKSRPNNVYATIFEAGADAILEALKELPLTQEIRWEYMSADIYREIGLKILVQYGGKQVDGWLVFIPEGDKGEGGDKDV